jgi:hypothetical protein
VTLRAVVGVAMMAVASVIAQGVRAQDMALPGMELSGAAPTMDYGGGSYFMQDLGTTLRLRYNTESYGSNKHGNFDIGTMQMWTMDGAAAFVDGQVTMNDIQGVGYNLGLGYRWLHASPFTEMGRMAGVSIWSDGTSTGEGGFFPQIGLSLESLGEMWDWRANGYLPVGDDTQIGDFAPTGVTTFQGFNLIEQTQAIVDTSYAVAELEGARRLGSERDAWVYAGPYFVGNDEDESGGIRAGLRGYAYPDVLLQIGVSHDDVFDTHATFSVMWFVGRTRTDFEPACGVPDRFREPVLRNDYVALSQSFVFDGEALTDADGDAIRIVHVDSTAAAGGDGTFENPFDMLSDVNGAGSLEGDIILAHAESVFIGDVSTILKDNQRLLGEGDGIEHTVATQQQGLVIIPETAPGARDAAKPQINGAAPGGIAIQLADANEVNNFDIDGMGVTNQAIASDPVNGSGNPVLRNLDISNTVDDAIHLTVLDFVDTEDIDNDTIVNETFVRGNLTIDDVTFDNIGGDDIDYLGSDVDPANPNTTYQELIAITDVETTNGNGRGIAIERTHGGSAARSVTINNYDYDGGANGLAGIELTNFDSTFNASNATFTNSNTGGNGVNIFGDSDGTITFATTAVFTSIDGTTINVDGGAGDELGAVITFNGTVDTDTGRSVRIVGMDTGASVTFAATADIEHTTTGANSEGVLIESNSDGTVTFNGDLILTTDGSIAFDANETGNNVVLAAPSANNSINTENATGLRIIGVEVAAAGVNFPEFNASGGTNGAELRDNTGGPITIGVLGNDPGETGTIAATEDGIVIDNSANVTVSGVMFNVADTFAGVLVNKDSTGTQTTNLNDLEINNGATGVEVTGNGMGGALNLTLNDSEINSAADASFSVTNVDTGNIQINNSALDGMGEAAADGIRVTGSNAAITVDIDPANDNTVVQGHGGDEVEVDDGSPNFTFNGSIVNTAGRSVNVHDIDGGSVTFTTNSSIDDDGEGLIVGGLVAADGNSGGVISFLGTNDFDTTTFDAVTVANNTGTTDVVFEDLDINTTSGDGVVIEDNASTTSVLITGVDVTATTTGRGFFAESAGDLTVGGNNNVIVTNDGVGLTIDGMNIVSNALFESVTVDGAVNGVVLRSLTGARVTVGESGAADAGGGNLTTTGDAIVVENVALATFNSVQVTNASGGAARGVALTHTTATNMDATFNNLDVLASGDDGFFVNHTSANLFNLRLNSSTLAERVDMDITGSGQFALLVDNTDVTTGGTDVAFDLTFSGNPADGDVTIQNTSTFTANNAQAFLFTVDGVGKSVEINVDNNTFNRNVAGAAGDRTVEMFATGGATLNANVVNNSFNNFGAGEGLLIDSNIAATVVNLNLINNGPVGADLRLRETAGDFNVVDLLDVDTNNPGDVILQGTFDDIPGPVEPPVVP